MKKQAFNPFLPTYEYIPDGEPYVFGDRVYIYGSHDAFNGHHYCVNNYVCWSAPVDDLGNWRYEGVILDKTKDPLCDDASKRRLYAPDVQLGADGKYYLYYAFDELGVISVAVCDTPAGEYEFYGHVHYPDGTLLGKKEGDIFQFDPGVYREGNQVYLYSGFCPFFPWKPEGTENGTIKGPVVVELEPDMLTVKTEPKVILPWVGNSAGTTFEGNEFFEASSMRKVGDKYYFVYSSVNGSALCYAVSDYPDRDFVFGGPIVSNGDVLLDGRGYKDALNYLGNIHGSLVQIQDDWYIFYHRHTNKIQFSRQACAEKVAILADGSIPQVEITSCGLNGGPLRGKGQYDAAIACNLMSKYGVTGYGMESQEGQDIHPYFTQSGSDREDNPDQYIANMCDGALAGFKYFEMKGADKISVTVRGAGEGRMYVTTQLPKDRSQQALEREASRVAVIELDEAADWRSFAAALRIKEGVTALYFIYSGEGAYDFDSFTLE